MGNLNEAPGLRVCEGLPAGFLFTEPADLAERLGGSTLFHLSGRRSPPLFVSVLLHGNEVTGIEAVQRLLQRYTHKPLPRDLSVFVGNVHAAARGLRRLAGQPDFNRIWPGTEHADSAEALLVAEVTETMRRRGCFASIDIHNNTGLNPHYACVNRLEPRYLALASLFSRTIVYFTRPRGVQSQAFAELCPATTVECGQPGSTGAAEHAVEFLEAALHLEHVPEHVVDSDLGVYHTIAVVRMNEGSDVAFEDDSASLSLPGDLDEMNFRDLPTGTILGWVRDDSLPVTVFDNEGRDITADYLEAVDGRLLTRRRVMPSMLSRDPRVIRQDCLCYFMERIALGEPRLEIES